MKRTIIEVAPAKSGGWEAKERHSSRALLVNDNKARVVSEARRRARDMGNSQLIIKKRDGKIQTEYTYGNDPARYPG